MNTDVVVQEVPEKKRSLKKVFLMFGAVITSIFGSMFSASAATPDLIMPLTVTEGADLSNLGVVFTQITSWVTSIVSTITASPILLVGLGIFVVGAIIGLAYRLIRG